MQINELTQTCSACPSQWEGRTDDGRPVYIRFRWGYLSVQIGKTNGGDIMEAVDAEEFFGKQISDDLDGVIEWDRVAELADLTTN